MEMDRKFMDSPKGDAKVVRILIVVHVSADGRRALMNGERHPGNAFTHSPGVLIRQYFQWDGQWGGNLGALAHSIRSIQLEHYPMMKALTCSLLLTAVFGLAACDKKSEDKAQEAQKHAEHAQEKMSDAQDKVKQAAKEDAEAAQDHAQAKEAAAQEAQQQAPSVPLPQGTQTPSKN
jgi:hypothetical protein